MPSRTVKNRKKEGINPFPYLFTPTTPPSVPDSTEPRSIVMLCVLGVKQPDEHTDATKIIAKYPNPDNAP